MKGLIVHNVYDVVSCESFAWITVWVGWHVIFRGFDCGHLLDTLWLSSVSVITKIEEKPDPDEVSFSQTDLGFATFSWL